MGNRLGSGLLGFPQKFEVGFVRQRSEFRLRRLVAVGGDLGSVCSLVSVLRRLRFGKRICDDGRSHSGLGKIQIMKGREGYNL